tara:strand:- start:769 stop:1056 length:288 start_codon:yes stop_codon:yes gene_type:complete
MIRVGDVKDVKSMNEVIGQITDAICECIAIPNRWEKNRKMGNIAGKIEALRLKCVVNNWKEPLDKLSAACEIMDEAAMEFDSAKFKLKSISNNAK